MVWQSGRFWEQGASVRLANLNIPVPWVNHVTVIGQKLGLENGGPDEPRVKGQTQTRT